MDGDVLEKITNRNFKIKSSIDAGFLNQSLKQTSFKLKPHRPVVRKTAVSSYLNKQLSEVAIPSSSKSSSFEHEQFLKPKKNKYTVVFLIIRIAPQMMMLKLKTILLLVTNLLWFGFNRTSFEKPDEICDRLRLMFHLKLNRNATNRSDDEFFVIFDRILENKRLIPTQLK